ncbi:hypothetical protein D515_01304 [Grimontia indica]|uniref:Uncharacterized protein n=1 Tax=Grimontia indica TaxID=1056512 RepID=R1IW72_9GAMM|nr:hypothetical protein D515_01304 [Grimontia indica]
MSIAKPLLVKEKRQERRLMFWFIPKALQQAVENEFLLPEYMADYV